VLTREDLFSRIEQLAEDDPNLHSIVRSAELAFWEDAKKGEWLAWPPSDDPEAPPPYWEAAFQYLEAVVPGYISCCTRIVGRAAELEKHIAAWVLELVRRVYEYKVLFYCRGRYWASVQAAQQFEQAARNRLAMTVAAFRAKAWRAGPAFQTPSSGTPTAGAGSDSDRRVLSMEHGPPTQDCLPTPVEERWSVVDRYRREFHQTLAQICKGARVDRSDFYKWIKGHLQDTSSKSARIENVLHVSPGFIRPERL